VDKLTLNLLEVELDVEVVVDHKLKPGSDKLIES